MQFSFMTFSTPELDLKTLLETAKRLGYDAVEPRLDSKHAHGIEVSCSPTQRAEVRRSVERSGVRLSCLATSCRFANPETRAAEKTAAVERIRLAGDVGAPVLRVFGGDFPATSTREQATDGLIESLKSLAETAEASKVTVCLETHDSWCDPAQVAEVLRRVGHARIAANWDILHPVRTGKATIQASYELLKPWIRHVHVHDWAGDKFAPIGTGIVDHRLALSLLEKSGYDGAVSGEWIGWEPWEQHLPRELATMKSFL